MKYSKPLLGGLFLLLLLSAFTSACGNENVGSRGGSEAKSAAPSVDEASATASASAESSSGMRTFTDATGITQQIPVNPQRIVTSGLLDVLLTLGVKPIGAGSWEMKADYLKGRMDGVSDLGNTVNAEQILELEPDLIVVSGEEEPEEIVNLRKIAPTVVVPFAGSDVYKLLQDVAAVVNREEQAEQWIAGVQSQADEIKAKIQDQFKPDDTFAMFWVYGKDALRVYGARNIGHVFYRMLGLNPPELIRDKLEQDPDYNDFYSENISMEMLPEYAGDYIIMCIYDEESREGMFKQLEESALWKNLPAVKDGHVFIVGADPWFSYSPLAIESQLQQVQDLLL